MPPLPEGLDFPTGAPGPRGEPQPPPPSLWLTCWLLRTDSHPHPAPPASHDFVRLSLLMGSELASQCEAHKPGSFVRNARMLSYSE